MRHPFAPAPGIIEQLPFLAHRQPGARVRIIRASNASPSATAPQAAVAVSAEQQERDWYFEQLVSECRAGNVRPSRIDWLLSESGRTREQLDDALERAEINEGKPATSSAAKLTPVFAKESEMSETEKRQIKSQWEAAVRTMQADHPQWAHAKCVSAVVKENPGLHERLLNAANS